MISPPAVNIIAIVPELVIACSAIVLILLAALVDKDKISSASGAGVTGWAGVYSLLVLLASVFFIHFQNGSISSGALTTFSGMIILDRFAIYCNYLIALAAIAVVLMSLRYDAEFDLKEIEFYILILFCTVGMMLMASAGDLLALFIALEIMSLSIYVLVGFVRAKNEAHEAAFKYFTLGAFASAIFVFGSALIYGQVGSTRLADIASAPCPAAHSPLLMLGIAMILAAFFFKVSGVPFHMWTPDVYQAAPMPITGFMATGVKIAAFAGLIRFLVSSHAVAGPGLEKALYVLAMMTLLLGSMAALSQRNLKRLLAYSSITHVGYMVMALLPGSPSGYGSVLFYLLTYLIVNVGLFSILICFSRKGAECATFDDLKGLGRQHPYMALLVGIFIFSLAGIPPTAGFMGKLTLFYAAVQGGYIGLTVLAVLTSAISLFYYLKILMAMFSESAEGTPSASGAGVEAPHTCPLNPLAVLIAGIAAAAVMIIGILPGSFINWAAQAAGVLF